jgi:type IV pilus assembly protein PilC
LTILFLQKEGLYMPEYRIEGVTLSGKVVSGSITADTKSVAKKRAHELGRDKKFKITDIHERVAYIYRVQKGTDKPIDGEQKAFTASEVRT